jgi:purine-binding chemotaxis protein CheW
MFVLPPIHRPPGLAPHERGVTRRRDMALPALDLRVYLGLASAVVEVEELIQLLHDREKDHRDWLDDLDASVVESRPFTRATDAHQCAFGRWYDGFRTENAVLRSELSRIEQPHTRIHALAAEVSALLEQGDARGARERIEHARGGALAECVRAFEAIRTAVRQEHREIGVIVEFARSRRVLIVDSAEAVADVEPFAEGDDPVARGDLRLPLVRQLGRWKGSERPVLLLDLQSFRAA